MDFAKGKIYRIYNPNIQDSLEYVGSTSMPYLSTRMGKHRADYKLAKGCRSFKLFDEYGVENCIIELIENYPCADCNELHRREGYYIQERTCVNKYIAGRTTKEWREANREANKEKYSIKNKEYYQANKEYFKDYRKTYRQTDKYKAYKEENKEKTKTYNKAYREKQKAARECIMDMLLDVH